MKPIEEQIDFKEKNKHSDVLTLNDQFENQKLLWIQTKIAISSDVKLIIWKAWIEPLEFKKYENSVLYLCANSYLISSRAETQYYEIIFLQATKMFGNLKTIKILKDIPEKNIYKEKRKNNNQVLTSKISIKSDDEVSFLTSASMQLNPKFIKCYSYRFK